MRISWRMGLVWLALVTATGVPWVPSRSTPAPSEPARAAIETASPDQPLETVTLAALSQTTTRPLFNASRRPSPPPTVKPAMAPVKPKATHLVGYRLTGIVRSSSQRMILLTEEKSGRVVKLHEGDQVDGWLLVSIGTDHVRLSRAGHEIDLLNPRGEVSGPSGRNTRWLPSAGGRR
jgi:hypothetical protein